LGGRLEHCTLTGNSAYWGGGASESVLTNCTLNGNWATGSGGGGHGVTRNVSKWRLDNCTLTRQLGN